MIIIIAVIAVIIMSYLASPKPAKSILYITRDSKTLLKPDGWKGTPVDSKGRFMNDEHPYYQEFLKIYFWLPSHLINLVKNRNVKFPVVPVTDSTILKRGEKIIWLGHASFFLRVNDINILIDPHFNDIFIYRRHTANPVDPNLFSDIHFILLSHDHADHCDELSLQLLIKNNPEVTILCGLNMDMLLKSFIQQPVKIVTAAWYELFPVSTSLEIYFVPSRHYSKRVFKKFNSTLWGGFIIRYKKADGLFQIIYYSGDSGYANHFKEIKTLFNPSLAILPIGAYKPRWFMHPNHMAPEETRQAFEDCGAKKMIPMHYNTFNLSNENMDEPKKKTEELTNNDALINLQPGEEFKL